MFWRGNSGEGKRISRVKEKGGVIREKGCRSVFDGGSRSLAVTVTLLAPSL